MQTALGIKRVFMIFQVDTWPPIHSIVVVTSPIGVHAPPAFAAMMVIPINNNFISRPGMSLRISDTITIVVVRLSRMAERKNASQQMIHNNIVGFLVVILSVIKRKPWWA